jgi:hypothetical protein
MERKLPGKVEGELPFDGWRGINEYLGRQKELDLGRTDWEGWRVNNEKVGGTKRDLLGKDREKATLGRERELPEKDGGVATWVGRTQISSLRC